MNRLFSIIVLTPLLTSTLALAFNIQPVLGSGTIYIRADGSIDPPTAPIRRNGDLYTFTDNIYDSIVVQRNNIIVDGASYTLQGSGSGNGLYLSGINNVTIQNTKIKNFSYGVYLYSSSFNTILGNTLTNNDACGVFLFTSSNFNLIKANNITTTREKGIYLLFASNNTIEENDIINNGDGILLSYSSNNNVWTNNLTNNGIYLQDSSNYNNISGNNMLGSLIDVWSSNFNSICKNAITKAWQGLALEWASNNTVSGNVIVENYWSISLDSSSNNSIYHNNYINNTKRAWVTAGYSNTWDDDFRGNFWSDYTGVDADGDSIGDTPYTIDANNQDRYPLIVPVFWDYSTPIPIVWEAVIYPVELSSNSTISTFKFNQPQMQISFNVTGSPGTVGYCNVTIPMSLLSDNPWTITINGQPPMDFVPTSNDTHNFLYFTYTHASTSRIVIQGTSVIPEFPSTTILPLFTALCMLAVAFAKRKFPRKRQT